MNDVWVLKPCFVADGRKEICVGAKCHLALEFTIMMLEKCSSLERTKSEIYIFAKRQICVKDYHFRAHSLVRRVSFHAQRRQPSSLFTQSLAQCLHIVDTGLGQTHSRMARGKYICLFVILMLTIIWNVIVWVRRGVNWFRDPHNEWSTALRRTL